MMVICFVYNYLKVISEEDIAEFFMSKFLENIHNNYSFAINKIGKPDYKNNKSDINNSISNLNDNMSSVLYIVSGLQNTIVKTIIRAIEFEINNLRGDINERITLCEQKLEEHNNILADILSRISTLEYEKNKIDI
jgi:hypothetical protein